MRPLHVISGVAGCLVSVSTLTAPWSPRSSPSLRYLEVRAVGCSALHSPYLRTQVERFATLRLGHSWPRGWREVSRSLLSPTAEDSLVARDLGLQPPESSSTQTLPEQWVAFVVDATGRVAACSIRTHNKRELPRSTVDRLSGLRFRPAQVGGADVKQVVLLQVR